jgi:hypothetical protein
LSQESMPADPTNALDTVTKQYNDGMLWSRVYPLDQYGLVAVTIPIECITTATAVTVNTIEVCRIYVPAGKAITGAAVNVATVGTTPGSTNDSGFCLYADDGSSQIAKSTNDYTLFTTAGWRSKAFASSVAAQTVGKFYRLAMLHSCSGTAPKFGTGSSTASSTWNVVIPSGTHRRQVFATSTLTFPTSFTVSTFGTLDNPLICLALY